MSPQRHRSAQQQLLNMTSNSANRHPVSDRVSVVGAVLLFFTSFFCEDTKVWLAIPAGEFGAGLLSWKPVRYPRIGYL